MCAAPSLRRPGSQPPFAHFPAAALPAVLSVPTGRDQANSGRDLRTA